MTVPAGTNRFTKSKILKSFGRIDGPARERDLAAVVGERLGATGKDHVELTVPLAEVDRAVLDGEAEGFFRVLVRQGSDRIVGATLVAEHAGETIAEVSVAMAGRVGLGTLANVVPRSLCTSSENVPPSEEGAV